MACGLYINRVERDFAVQRLADAAPAEMLASLKGPLQEALQGVQQDVDRPRTCASAEALSGLLACSATYHSPGGRF